MSTSNLYGSSNMGLGLSQVGPQMQEQNNSQSSDILRLVGARPGQFDHLLPPGIAASSFRPPQAPMASSAFFMHQHESNQNYRQQQGLMQFSNLQNSPTNPPTSSNLFNLSYLSNTSSNANNNNNSLPSSGLLIPDHFNNNANATAGGGEGSNIFSANINMADQISSGVPSLYSASLQTNNAIPHMSATALLQKAAQMGSTTSNNSTASLLSTFGSSSSSNGTKSLVPAGSLSSMFGEHESHLQDLMNSFASGNSSILSAFSGYNAGRTDLQHMDEEPKLQPNLTVSVGGSDRLTRDFLGVGQIVRSMSGVSQRDQKQQQQQHYHHHHHHHGIDMSSLDSDRNTSVIAAAAAERTYRGT